MRRLLGAAHIIEYTRDWKMSKRLILLTSDRSFVLPTLIACTQILEQAGMRQIADAMIVTTDLTIRELELLSETGSQIGVDVHQLTLKTELLNNLHFNKTHVPISTLARLFTPELIDTKYDHVVYIDGDVQIVGEIQPLVCYDVPKGKLLAAPDRFVLGGMSFGWRAESWREDLLYLSSLGIDKPSEYFNAGVLAASRSTWSSACEEALDFFKKNSQLCKFHDQSALNAVCKGETIKLSPAYNFHTSLRQIGAEDFLSPKIIHFTGANKPWLVESQSSSASSYSSLIRSFQHRFPVCYDMFAIHNSSGPPRRQEKRESIKSKIYEKYGRYQRRRSFKTYLERLTADVSAEI
jgi:lipopolysaccharide biosynthesis glycosyltransferase